jgi:hypothetical protein
MRLFQPTPPELQRKVGWDFHVLNLVSIGLLGGLYYYGLRCVEIKPGAKQLLEQNIERKRKERVDHIEATLTQAMESLTVLNERIETFEKRLNEKKTEPKK